MRLVSDHVEFSWVGTAAVVAVFPIFGVGHLISSVLRRRGGASSKIGRGGGVLLTLPLFGAAGGMMLPTVVCGSLALWRVSWPRFVRYGLLLLGSAVPVFVSIDVLVSKLSLLRAVGVLMFIGSYAAVVYLTGPVTAKCWAEEQSAEEMRLAAI
jgi:hypothetical protein